MFIMITSAQSSSSGPNQAWICMAVIIAAWWVPTAPLGVPVVPPVNMSSAGSPGLTATSGRGAPAYWRSRSPSHRSPGCRLMRWPSFFSLSRPNSRRRSGGRYSLMLVAMTRRRSVRGCKALTLS